MGYQARQAIPMAMNPYPRNLLSELIGLPSLDLSSKGVGWPGDLALRLPGVQDSLSVRSFGATRYCARGPAASFGVTTSNGGSFPPVLQHALMLRSPGKHPLAHLIAATGLGAVPDKAGRIHCLKSRADAITT